MKYSFILVSVFILLFLVGISSAGENIVIFSDNFESGLDQWTIDSGNFDTVKGSLYMGGAGSIYKKFNATEMNSPNREINLMWKPTSGYDNITTVPLMLEEGAMLETLPILKMFYNDEIWFTSYQYYNGVVTDTNTSTPVTINKDQWNSIKIISNTSDTQIIINGSPVLFNGESSSISLSNTYNWVRFSNYNQHETIVTDGGNPTGNTNPLSENQYVWRKIVNVPINLSQLSGASLIFYMLTNNGTAPTGKVAIDVNGQRALTLSQTDLDDPTATAKYYTFSIDKSLLVQGNNNIDFYGVEGNTSSVLYLDGGSTNNTSYYSNDFGATYETLPGMEYICRLDLEFPPEFYYIDNLTLVKENVLSNEDLVGRVYDVMGSAIIPTNDPVEICAIYPYLLTRNPVYLIRAETAADNIEHWIEQGVKNIQYTREVALLASVNSSRIGLLNEMAQIEWEYQVNPTTKLPYKSLYHNGSAIDPVCYSADPLNCFNVVDDFIYAYKVTGNATYLSQAEEIMDAIYTYMRHPIYDTIITSVYATNGTGIGSNPNWDASRGGDQIFNYIESALFLYEVSGDSKHLDNAIYQADTWGSYTYNSTIKTYTYRPDETNLMEVFIPSYSLALVHLYEYTGNETYLERAETNYYNYWQTNRINGIPAHQFSTSGYFMRDPLVWEDNPPVISNALYNQTGNLTYLNIADECDQGALTWFIPQSAAQIDCESLKIYNDFKNNFQVLMWFETEMLYGFVQPSKEVKISWSMGNNFRAKYRGITTPITDVSFGPDSIELYNVSGNGSIRFHEGINHVNITAPVESTIGVNLADKLIITPTSGTVNVSVTNWATSGTYLKTWNETSANHDTNVSHIIRGFPANESVSIFKNGTFYETSSSNETGYVNWIYSGGFSEREFSVRLSTTLELFISRINAFLVPLQKNMRGIY